ncbi:hypothetical protein C3747_12g442 [Trypanosoma cruzi]|uniref:Doublecortin domain-containing protein n=2 Tax=Trypanosoma cruzi TaxID=5693 RepID=Q4DJU3_TRYCC|nr:hypothetical protein, conserved [Trypanosoma cruzi]EAN92810.1 hypothetical protein, conserved [Trypanosoma cruzi]PWV18743.1 hypothetical protein C3747_12g442 [Trypanosoma cruzi]RNC49162.1 hypothetical protein TcCL_NonESM00996 [Trypanosoma cruzi]|eukprot:XP_814661.1 hypothetical protein [Trypanosoma cruzi strain CL Brener]
MTEAAGTSPAKIRQPQRLRDSFDGDFCLSDLDEGCEWQEWKRDGEKSERMDGDLMERHKACWPESGKRKTRVPLDSTQMPPAASENTVATHEQLLYDANCSTSGDSGFRGEEYSRRNHSEPVARGPHVWKGPRSDILDLDSESRDDVDAHSFKVTDGAPRTTNSKAVFPRPLFEDFSSARESCHTNKCCDYSDGPHCYSTGPSGKVNSARSRVPGISSTRLKAKPRNLTASPVQQKSFWINVWPCFGTFTSFVCKPTRILVHSSYCYMVHVTEKAGTLMGCRPAPSVLYEPDGRSVRSLAQLLPEQHYLLFPSGGFYRKEAVPAALLEEFVRAAKMALQLHSQHCGR